MRIRSEIVGGAEYSGRVVHQSNINHVLGSVEVIPNVSEVEAGTSIVVDVDDESLY